MRTNICGDFDECVLSGSEGVLLEFYSIRRHSLILGDEDFISRVRGRGFSVSGERVGYETGILRPRVSSVI
jgi:hypothetical protein